MKFDMRCMAKTIQCNVACARGVTMKHIPECECERTALIITHKTAVVINAPNMGNHCPCGLPKHQGMCSDAMRTAQGLEPIKWRP
jgi:hypothetical protein